MKTYDIPMDTGEPVKGTFNIGALARLARDRHDLWDYYNNLYKKMQSNYVPNEIEMGKLIYVAYMCANIDHEPMSEEEFLYYLTDSREEIGRCYNELYGVQEKKQNFQMHSGKRHEKRTKG